MATTLHEIVYVLGPILAGLGILLALWRIHEDLPPRAARIFQWSAYAAGTALLMLGWGTWSTSHLLALMGVVGIVGFFRTRA